MVTIDSLREYGADVDEGLARCLNKEDFYLKMVNMGIADDRFEKLPDIIASKDYAKAFEIVHALKGIVGSLALTPLYEPICQMTELLRKQTQTDYTDFCETIKSERKKLLAL